MDALLIGALCAVVIRERYHCFVYSDTWGNGLLLSQALHSIAALCIRLPRKDLHAERRLHTAGYDVRMLDYLGLHALR
jgi:hypothetical protein